MGEAKAKPPGEASLIVVILLPWCDSRAADRPVRCSGSLLGVACEGSACDRP